MGDDQLMPGAVTLEGETPTIDGPPVGAAADEAVATVVDPAGPEAEAEPDGTTTDLRGQKLVPLHALQVVRSELKQYKEQARAATQLQAEVEQLRGKAQTADQVTAWVESVRPLLTKLKDRPDVVQAIMAGQQVSGGGEAQPDPATQGPLPLDEAEDLARTLELYTAEGKPDLARAQRMAVKMTKLADSQASARVAPFVQAAVDGQSGTLRQQYAAMKDKAGRTVNAQILDQMWKLVPSHLVAQDPNVAGVLYYAAKGYAAHHGLDEPAPPASMPVVTESAGGGLPSASRTLSDLERRFARTMGGGEKKFSETAAGYKPGGINVLE